MNRKATIRIESDTGSALARGARRFERAWRTGKDQGGVLVPFSRIRTEFDLMPKQAA